MHAPGVELCQAHRALLLLHVEEPGDNLDGIGTFLVDVVARVSAIQSFHGYTEEEKTRRGFLTLKAESGGGVLAACARYENLSFLLRVDVDEHIARHKTGLHAESTGQTCLLVAGEHTLYRAMSNVVAVEQGQLHGATNTVVGTQRGAFGAKPFAVNVGLNGIVVKVEVDVHQFLTHHVHVALQNQRLAVLVTGRGAFAD